MGGRQRRVRERAQPEGGELEIRNVRERGRRRVPPCPCRPPVSILPFVAPYCHSSDFACSPSTATQSSTVRRKTPDPRLAISIVVIVLLMLILSLVSLRLLVSGERLRVRLRRRHECLLVHLGRGDVRLWVHLRG